MQNPDQVVNSTPMSDQRQTSHLPAPPYHTHPIAAAGADMRQDSPHRVMSSSTSDVQSAADPSSRVVYQPQVPFPHSPVQQWSQSLTRGSTRTDDERLGVWAPNAAMASSMPSIPCECAPGGDTSRSAAESTISTKEWLDSLQRKKKVSSISQSTDRMCPVSLNPAGGPRSLGYDCGAGSLGRRSADSCRIASRSTLARSDDSFAVIQANSRHSLHSRDSVASQDSQNGRNDSSSSKRRVRFELQPTPAQRVPDQRQRSSSSSRSDKRQRAVGDQASGTDRVLTADDDAEGRSTSRASGSFFSKFRRVVADGVVALLGRSKQKSNEEDSSDTQPTCNGHMPANSFEDMTEMERLATVADRVASERLRSAVLHGKLPTQNDYRGDSRPHGRPYPSVSDSELANIEACFAGLRISPATAQQEQLACPKHQDFVPWRGSNSTSSSVSEELRHLPSNACSSYVQFMPKSVTVPCSIGSSYNVEPASSCRNPSASSSMGNVVLIECQCGSGPVTESESVHPTNTNYSDTSRMDVQRGGAYSENRCMQANSHPQAESSSILKSAAQPVTLNSQGHPGQHSSVTAADASRVREKSQPPSKVSLPSSTTCFREGLLPTPAGVEDFRIRRQLGSTSHGSQSGPMKATVPFLKQSNSGNSDTSSANARRPPPPPPPTRNFATAVVCELSTESDSDARRLTLQELSAMVDKEVQANERLEMNSDVVDTTQTPNLAAECSNGTSNHVDLSRVTSSSTCGREPVVQSKDNVDAQLKSLGFDDTIWSLEADEILGGSTVRVKKLGVSGDEEEDSASTLTDCSGSVSTATTSSENRPISSENNRLQPPNDVVDAVSGCGSVKSVDHDLFSRSPNLSTLSSSSSYSLPAISEVSEVLPADGDPAQSRCSSTNIPLPHTCREDVRGRWRQPDAFAFNQLTSGTTAEATCSPYNSKSSGIGSLIDSGSGSVPNSPV